MAIGTGQHTQTCVATTSVQGTATCTVAGVTQPLGDVAATATFAGDAGDDPSTATGTVLIQADTQLSLTTTGAAVFGAALTLHARLSDSNDRPIPGQHVTLTAGTAHCPTTTTATGTASCTIAVTDAAGAATSSATFDGTATLLSSSAVAPFGVLRQPTHTAVIVAATPVDGRPAVLRAALTDAAGNPLSGQGIQFALSATGESDMCHATTDADGIATCSAHITVPRGGVTITASYAGNPYYDPSSATSANTVRAALDRLVVTPDPDTAAPGQPVTYTAHGIDIDGKDVGDVTVATAFHIEPDGTCTHARCTAVNTGTHTVTADDHGTTGQALLAVNADQTGETSTSPTTPVETTTTAVDTTQEPPTTTTASSPPTTQGSGTTTVSSQSTPTAPSEATATEQSTSTGSASGTMADTGPRAVAGLVTAGLLTLAAGVALNRAGRPGRPKRRRPGR